VPELWSAVTLSDKAIADVAEGKMRAAVQRAQRGPEVAAAVDRIHANVPDIVRRMYWGPPNKKGRSAYWIAPADKLSPAQFHAPGADAKGRIDGKW
jgi:hypothetical protein